MQPTATPDRISNPEWKMDIKLWTNQSIALTYHQGILYACRSTHWRIYNEWKIKTPGFDCRLVPELRAFTFWYDEGDGHTPGKVREWIREIREKLKTGDFISDDVGRIEIGDYEYFFMGEDGPVRCGYDELDRHVFSTVARPCKPVDSG